MEATLAQDGAGPMFRRSKLLLAALLARRYQAWTDQGQRYLQDWLRRRAG